MSVNGLPGRWETRFKAANLGNSTAFYWYRRVRMGSIREVIESHPETDDSWRIQRPTGWSCATWVFLRVMITWEEMAIFDIPDGLTPEMLYDSILGEGYRFMMGNISSNPLAVVQLVLAGRYVKSHDSRGIAVAEAGNAILDC
ncbi:uncharacterized protein BT62DRAFT_796375 [Guyanagaster necrorhizus]|uniref:Uncharacterized protein n=1 Tax=Guyanagaster necrorhizus TaxID=856835 RepID=A0A9P7VUR3_9AGAR|nr:uncharacterized protein BT62DRAFT_796375 [Guyanagaster necrorhizus MCA 3950]KAG7447856.1 hypothetical protein BT62DRAFT_796375 [Guyanagaster necrorhizus MCA 3950]